MYHCALCLLTFLLYTLHVGWAHETQWRANAQKAILERRVLAELTETAPSSDDPDLQRASFRAVNTPEEFADALRHGVSHIELRRSIDTRHVSLPNSHDIKSIRGNCAASDTGAEILGEGAQLAPILKIKPYQCTVVMGRYAAWMWGQVVWLDGLYLRIQMSFQDSLIEIAGFRPKSERLWLTNVVIQGSGSGLPECEVCGFRASGFTLFLGSGGSRAVRSRVYAERCVMADLTGSTVAEASTGGSISMKNCLITGNTLLNQGTQLANALRAENGSGNKSRSFFRLEDAHFIDNTAENPLLIEAHNSRATSQDSVQRRSFYTDTEHQIAVIRSGQKAIENGMELMSKDPLELAQSLPEDTFLSLDDPVFLHIQQECIELGGRPLDTSTGSRLVDSEWATGTADSRTGDTPIYSRQMFQVLMPLSTGVALVALCGAAVVLWRRRNRSAGKVKELQQEVSSVCGSVYPMSYTTLTTIKSVITASTVWKARTEPPKPPLEPTDEAIGDYIEQQLDCYGSGTLYDGSYELLGPKQRVRGGEGVVQFANRKTGNTFGQYALKFFISRTAYEEEAAWYSQRDSQLTRFFPKMLECKPNDSGDILDPFEKPMPPCIVLERGHCLRNVVSRGQRAQWSTVAKVLRDVSERIQSMHEARYVHRDLKPDNIMLVINSNTWVLIDFGCCAKIGDQAPLGYTPTYAAPETAAAARNNDSSVVASTAVDAWSLGVIAFELLVGRCPFVFNTADQILDKLIDPNFGLPWENEYISEVDRNKLGSFLLPIQKLLTRDPRKRSTVTEFLSKLNHRVR